MLVSQVPGVPRLEVVSRGRGRGRPSRQSHTIDDIHFIHIAPSRTSHPLSPPNARQYITNDSRYQPTPPHEREAIYFYFHSHSHSH